MSENLPNESIDAGLNSEQNQPEPQESSVDNNPDVQQSDDSGNKEPADRQTDKSDAEIYGCPEQFDYSTTVLPEGMELDKELINEFEPIARKLNLSNKSANELMGLAVKLTEKNFAKIGDIGKQIEAQEKAAYIELLNSDKELNISDSEKYDSYLDIANQGLKATATKGFMELLKQKGLTYHPEFIKTFHKIGELCSQDKLPDVKIPAAQNKADAADILYASRERKN